MEIWLLLCMVTLEQKCQTKASRFGLLNFGAMQNCHVTLFPFFRFLHYQCCHWLTPALTATVASLHHCHLSLTKLANWNLWWYSTNGDFTVHPSDCFIMDLYALVGGGYHRVQLKKIVTCQLLCIVCIYVCLVSRKSSNLKQNYISNFHLFLSSISFINDVGNQSRQIKNVAKFLVAA